MSRHTPHDIVDLGHGDDLAVARSAIARYLTTLAAWDGKPDDRTAGVVSGETSRLALNALNALNASVRATAVGASRGSARTVEARPPDRTSLAVLDLLARGETDSVVAHHLSLSERTVRRIVSRLCVETRAHSRFELAIRCIERGWLTTYGGSSSAT